MLDALGMTTQKDWIEYVKSFNNITDLNELQPCLTEINQLRFQFLFIIRIKNNNNNKIFLKQLNFVVDK